MVQLVKRHLTLNNASSFWDGTVFMVNVPDILSWDLPRKSCINSIVRGIMSSYFLRSMFGEERNRIVSFLLDFMKWMRKNGMFWEGAAPRHLLVEELGRSLSLVDFERPIILQEYSFSEEEFKVLLRGTVHEEFCAFLLKTNKKRFLPTFGTMFRKAKFLHLQSEAQDSSFFMKSFWQTKRKGAHEATGTCSEVYGRDCNPVFTRQLPIFSPCCSR